MTDTRDKHKLTAPKKGRGCKMNDSTNRQRVRADVQLSKSLSWVLRHAAPSLGLKLALDGYVPVEEVLNLQHPRFWKDGRAKYEVGDVVRVVENNDKQRFRLEYRDVAGGSLRTETETGNGEDEQTSGKGQANTEQSGGSNKTEGGQRIKVLCIRANQGHSLKGLQADQLLTPLTAEELSDPNLTIVHGTSRKAWEDHIRDEGLSRMKRNHIHFASGLPKGVPTAKRKHSNAKCDPANITAPISGMRSLSEVYIYIDGRKCAEAGIRFYRSDNGVLLTAGVDEGGMLPTRYFAKVVCALSGKELRKGEEAV